MELWVTRQIGREWGKSGRLLANNKTIHLHRKPPTTVCAPTSSRKPSPSRSCQTQRRLCSPAKSPSPNCQRPMCCPELFNAASAQRYISIILHLRQNRREMGRWSRPPFSHHVLMATHCQPYPRPDGGQTVTLKDVLTADTLSPYPRPHGGNTVTLTYVPKADTLSPLPTPRRPTHYHPYPRYEGRHIITLTHTPKADTLSPLPTL